MDNKKAIEELESLMPRDCVACSWTQGHKEALEMAIKALDVTYDKTIEERANKAYPIYGEGYFDNDIKNACFHAYCKGARGQKAIDDNEKKELVEGILDEISDNVCFDKFGRPFKMEEFRDKWMKKLEE